MNTLSQIKQTLTSKLSSPSLFSLINTRLILKTGCDLGQIKPEKDQDPQSVTKVLTALQAMGYSL